VKTRTKILTHSGIISFCTLPFAFAIILIFRSLGWLQPLEWAAYDWFFQLRPLEPIDERIVIVGMNESDIDILGHPISDRNLARLIEKIKQGKPRAIGLDLVRDRPVEEGNKELNRVFATTSNLVGVAKIVGDKEETINPPLELERRKRVTSIDVTPDGDGVLRRGFFKIRRTNHDTVYYNSLGSHLALLYLEKEGIKELPTSDKNGTQLKKISLYPLQKNDGGYQNIDAWDFQFLVNFRNPKRSFKKVSFSQVLREKVEPNLLKDKIVFIGMTAVSIKDEFYIPFSYSLNNSPKLVYGAEIQANIASDLLNSVLDGRPIIKVIPDAIEYVFIFIWGLGTAVVIWKLRKTEDYLVLFSKILGIIVITITLLFISSRFAFSFGWWLPFVPSILLISTTSVLFSGLILWKKNQELKILKEQLAFEKTQSAIAKFASNIGHELGTPIHFIKLLSSSFIEDLEEIESEIETQRKSLLPKSIETIKNRIDELKDYCKQFSESTNKMQGLVSELSFRKNLFQPVKIDINNLIDSILQEIIVVKQVQNKNFNFNLKTDYDLDIKEKTIIIQDLNKVASNLISNAFDAVLDRVKTEQKFQANIIVTTQKINKKKIKLIVADNGKGISSEIADSIYLPFYTTKEDIGGEGLGLHITYEVLKNNGGEIYWERKDGMTRFIIIFPVIS
jgi:CHASE2 domain-containing sensor protein/two-component sensor histidine kinase